MKEQLIKKLEDKYDKEFEYRKKSLNNNSLNIRENEGLYDAGFINGMRSILMLIDEYKYNFLTWSELEEIIEK